MDGAPASFDFAKEVVTQIIGLCTAVIAISATFAKDFKVPGQKPSYRWLFRAWWLMLASLLFGVLTLMSMAGTLANPPVTPQAIYQVNIASKAILEISTFLAGLCLLVWHAAKRIKAG